MEIQAILLAAGSGSRMTAVGVRSKCLLPIGNYPMIYYPLKLLEDNGFEDATIVINQRDEKEIKRLSEVYGLKIKLDFANVDTSNDPGTADSIRQIESKLKKNVDEILVISCDLLTNVSLQNLLNKHRIQGAALTILTADHVPEFVKASPPGPKSKSNTAFDVICFEEGSSRLVYAISAGDYDEQLKIPSRLLQSIEGGLDIVSNMLDAHLYVMKRWVLDYIVSKDSRCAGMGSLKAEVIPHLISEQFLKSDKTSAKNTLEKHVKNDRFEDLIRMYNTSIVPSRFQKNSRLDSRCCYGYHHPGFCVRINTTGSLWLSNRKFSEIREHLNIEAAASERSEIHEKSQICCSTLIGRDCLVSEKTNVTNSVIGEFCVINSKVRILNSLLFDHVEIAEGCIIENSFICVSISKRCTIRNCIVADSSKIESGGLYENDSLETGLTQDYLN